VASVPVSPVSVSVPVSSESVGSGFPITSSPVSVPLVVVASSSEEVQPKENKRQKTMNNVGDFMESSSIHFE